MILVVMAAGMGSRFGGSKQTTGFGPNGEFIIDYSIYDAICVGFEKVVFVIRRDNYDEFKDTIGKRIENKIKVEYAFQDMNDIPDGCSVPSDRVKPWGTGHALLSCRKFIDDNFIIVNADDFYGRSSFEEISKYLKNVSSTSKDYCMVSYYLKNTLSTNGSVSRGVCDVVSGNLVNIVERTNISMIDGKIVYDDNGLHDINEDALVSVNLWGFTPCVFEDANRYFLEFFNEDGDLTKKEFYLPTIVDKSIKEGIATVKVLNTNAVFSGVTYKEDKEKLQNHIKKLIDDGVYPENLWQ